jgi:hypothetical protein
MLVITVVVGVWATARAVTLGTRVLATRRGFADGEPSLSALCSSSSPAWRSSPNTTGSVRHVALIIGSLMALDGVTELMLAVDGRRRGTGRHVPVLTS